MNSDILFAAEGEQESVARGFAVAQGLIEECEQRFSRFRADSELSRLNRSGGKPFRASPDLFAVLALAQRLALQTSGLFEPTILPDLLRAGYDRTMDRLRVEGAGPASSTRPRRSAGIADIFLEPQDNLICLPPGAMIDLGGIAKGWIAEQAANALAAFSTACAVNAGGDMFLVGTPRDETGWSVEMEDPRAPEETLAEFTVGPGAVATSSVVKRAWMQGGALRHHLIDPRSGEPAETEWLSVTVIAPHAATAEVFAKALLIAGPNEAESIAHTEHGLAFLAADRTGRIWAPQKIWS